MPTFRRARSGLTERALESVRSQTFDDWELFVLDDGSTDGTYEIVSRHEARDSRIRVIRNERNSGLPARLINDAMRQARGVYFAFMFDDDLWYPDALRILIEGLDDNPDWAMAYGNVLFPYRDDAGEIHRERVLGHEPRVFDLGALERGNYIANVAVMLRSAILEQVGTFDPHILIRRLCDWDLWLRIARVASVGHLDSLIGEANGLLTNDSLGYTASMDYNLVRRYMSVERTALLKPGVVGEYRVDGLAILGDDLTDSEQLAAAEMLAQFYRQTGNNESAASWADRAAVIRNHSSDLPEGTPAD